VATYRLKKIPIDQRQQAEQALAQLLAQSRGMTMKMGQLLAGHSATDSYQNLVSSITPLPLSAILPSLQAQFQQPLSQFFSQLKASEAAASLGQVHYATLQKGDEVAIKIRYPNIVDTVNAELNLTAWLPNGGPFKRWRFNRTDYLQTLRFQLLRELDYQIEANTQQRFKDNLTVTGLHIPVVYLELSRPAVLVQSWETGVRLAQTVTWSKKARLEIGKTLLLTVLQSLFVHGEVHADPHSGNYLFRQNAQGEAITVLLDYGCTVLMTKPKRLALLKLLDAYQQNTPIDSFACFVAMGFAADKLQPIAEHLPAVCDILFRPFIQSRPFVLEQWQLAAQLETLLGEKRWWFRAAGPADLLLLLRAFHGLITQLSFLQVSLPWGALLRYIIPAEIVAQARALVLPRVDVTFTPSLIKMTARKLCVRVYEKQQLQISFDLPAEAVLQLDSLISPAIQAEINAHTQVDLKSLAAQCQSGIYPQTLLNSDNGLKRCQVWLE